MFQIQRRCSSEHVDQRYQQKKTESQIPFTHNSRRMTILVPIALFASLGWRGLGKRNKGPSVFRTKALPAKRSEKGFGARMFVFSCRGPPVKRNEKGYGTRMTYDAPDPIPGSLGKKLAMDLLH